MKMYERFNRHLRWIQDQRPAWYEQPGNGVERVLTYLAVFHPGEHLSTPCTPSRRKREGCYVGYAKGQHVRGTVRSYCATYWRTPYEYRARHVLWRRDKWVSCLHSHK